MFKECNKYQFLVYWLAHLKKEQFYTEEIRKKRIFKFWELKDHQSVTASGNGKCSKISKQLLPGIKAYTNWADPYQTASSEAV